MCSSSGGRPRRESSEKLAGAANRQGNVGWALSEVGVLRRSIRRNTESEELALLADAHAVQNQAQPLLRRRGANPWTTSAKVTGCLTTYTLSYPAGGEGWEPGAPGVDGQDGSTNALESAGIAAVLGAGGAFLISHRNY